MNPLPPAPALAGALRHPPITTTAARASTTHGPQLRPAGREVEAGPSGPAGLIVVGDPITLFV